MQVELIKKSVDIAASKARVWMILTEDAYTRQWYAPFSPGTHAETDWKVGSKVLVTDNSNCGLVGQVLINRPMDVLAVEYTGQVVNGVEDLESMTAKGIHGMKETYRLSDKNGTTHLDIDCDMASNYAEKMSAAWDEALKIIRELAEQSS